MFVKSSKTVDLIDYLFDLLNHIAKERQASVVEAMEELANLLNPNN